MNMPLLVHDRHRLAEATRLGECTALSHVWGRGSVVGIATRLRGYSRGIVVKRFPVGARDFPIFTKSLDRLWLPLSLPFD